MGALATAVPSPPLAVRMQPLGDESHFLEPQQETFAMEKNSAQHWLEGLFPPRFCGEDFFHQPETLICEKMGLERKKRREEFFNKARKELQKDREKSPFRVDLTKDNPKLEEKETSVLKERAGSISASHLDAEPGEKVAEKEGRCLWNIKELAALREEMSKEHLENLSLKHQLSFLKAELAEVQSKCKKIMPELKRAEEDLRQSREERFCMEVLLKHTERENLKRDSYIEALKQDLLGKSERIRSLTKELQEAKEEILHLDLGKKEQKRLKEQQESETKLAMEKMKLFYDAEIRKMGKALEEAKREQKREKALSSKLRKDLEILKRHFSSQALSSDFGQKGRIRFL
ncbi:coiled-coil domain-containing protein 160 [Anolis carolinensis]|uniref:coiled-coil domain-containing protein 160 n=1 Tax=Anolis carolinensis TaxID=28377 RepID=UPI002F2B1DA4